MDITSWENIKSKYKLGQFILGKVELHTPFGVFVNIDDSLVKGLIKIPDFLQGICCMEARIRSNISC
ncbi:hypothetical protein [Planktothrix agardhii]|jgi:ribosomal protein S1|uniref:hypothetical protein n=1 Tax=Planktothrix agardhii TaxID=1160 RepID=UPI0028AA1FC7|nr:hypothetical protein [Planktothrix agardhii]